MFGGFIPTEMSTYYTLIKMQIVIFGTYDDVEVLMIFSSRLWIDIGFGSHKYTCQDKLSK